MDSALLRGRDHTHLAEIAAIAEGACAVALSRGGAPKKYHHRDPNEDAVAFASGEAGSLIAVADAHDGIRASEVAIEHLMERYALEWTAGEGDLLTANWAETAVAVFADVNQAIAQAIARHGERGSCTTLAFALVRPAEDLLAFAAMGDSHVFRVCETSADDIARDAGAFAAFLGGAEESAETLRSRVFSGTQSLGPVRAVVLATDGISERGIGLEAPSQAVLESTRRAAEAEVSLQPLVTARTLVELALEAQRHNRSGDNVASAVIWLAP
jgi:serine/threonine protein phosphatase PrpC